MNILEKSTKGTAQNQLWLSQCKECDIYKWNTHRKHD